MEHFHQNNPETGDSTRPPAGAARPALRPEGPREPGETFLVARVRSTLSFVPLHRLCRHGAATRRRCRFMPLHDVSHAVRSEISRRGARRPEQAAPPVACAGRRDPLTIVIIDRDLPPRPVEALEHTPAPNACMPDSTISSIFAQSSARPSAGGVESAHRVVTSPGSGPEILIEAARSMMRSR